MRQVSPTALNTLDEAQSATLDLPDASPRPPEPLRNAALSDLPVPAVIMRGGTSKIVVFEAKDLPADPIARDAAILAAFGSPDPRQIDGLGGGDPLTSKVAIVGPSQRTDADIDLVFGQVGIFAPSINFQVSCGNSAAAVALYAVEQGLVEAQDSRTPIRIHDVNSGKLISAEVPTRYRKPRRAWHDSADFGVQPNPSIRISFLEPGGGVTGKLCPTGSATNRITLQDGESFDVSVIDCGNLYAFLAARDVGLAGTETPEELERHPELKRRIEEIRTEVCVQLLSGAGAPKTGSGISPQRLKIALIGEAQSYSTPEGGRIGQGSVDLVARIINQERVHAAYAVTGAICLAAAAHLPGSLVYRVVGERARETGLLRVGHPRGTIEVSLKVDTGDRGISIVSADVDRTARRIMGGLVYVRAAWGA